jgi:hypothetical protein
MVLYRGDMIRILTFTRSVCTKQNLLSPKAILVYFILLKLFICFFPVNYDYFRDKWHEFKRFF